MQSYYNLIEAAPVIPGNEAAGGTLSGLLLFITLALGFSFFCSILEAVLLSVRVSHTEQLIQEGKRSGLLMQKLQQNIERPISAILTLNTIAHTVGAAGAGAQAAGLFGNQFVGIISAVLTFLILVVSEIIPKTLGAVYWKELTGFAAYSIQILMTILYPVVIVFESFTKLIRPETNGPTITRTDIEVLAKVSLKEGALLERENRILRNLLRLNNVSVSTIITPRTVVFGLQEDLTIKEVLGLNLDIPYSRIPVFSKHIDDSSAYILTSEIYEKGAAGENNIPLKELGRELQAVPQSISVAQVFDEFIDKKEHVFLVIDEYGGAAGLVTMEDAIESLLGIEITDESDVVDDLRLLAEERYQRKIGGRVEIQTAIPVKSQLKGGL